MCPEFAPSPEVLDPATLQQLLDLDDGGCGLLREMHELFRDDTPPRMTLLEEAIRHGNREQMGDAAHALKGAASTMGALRVRAFALALETGARTGKFAEDPGELLAKLKSAFAEALGELETYLAGKP